jgi:protein TonB
MSTWVGSPAWTAAGSDRRPHVLQGLAVAAALSLGAHLAAMSSGSADSASSEAATATHALTVRTIVVPAPAIAAPVSPTSTEPSREAAPPAAREAQDVMPAPARELRAERPPAGRRVRGPEAATDGERSPGPVRSNATEPSVPAAAAAVKPSRPAYVPAGQLDPPPRPLGDIEPVYPPEAGYQSGKVVLRLLINETGVVDRVDVLRATPPGLFEASAHDAFAAARFAPGRLAGIAVKCEMTIEVDFTPINRGSEVSGRTY